MRVDGRERLDPRRHPLHFAWQSQYMDAPGQEPSVSMLDWSTGRGTAKYWVNDLLLSSFTPGEASWVNHAALPHVKPS